jgi:Required for respiratory growth protein 7
MATASVASTVHRGVAFEKRSLNILQSQLSMSLQKVGGKSDGGIDLQGWWWLPLSKRRASAPDAPRTWTGKDGVPRRRIRVLGQCKAEKKKMGPNYVRELEGVLGRHNSQPGQDPAVGLLISESAFTRSTTLRAFSSQIPLFLLHLPPEPTEVDQLREGEAEAEEHDEEADAAPDLIGSAVWNPALGSEQGLLRGEFAARWEWSIYTGGGRPGLWWKEKKLKSWVPSPTVTEQISKETQDP